MAKRADKSTQLKKEAMLKALESSLGVITTACKSVGISRKAHYKWMDKDPEYREAVTGMSDIALDFVETHLFKQIRSGDNAPTIFYLKTKGKHRGYVEKAPDQTDNINSQISTLNGLSEEDLRRLALIRSRLGAD